MSETIERLKAGLAEAQRKHNEVSKRFQAMQTEWQASNAELTGYQKVLELETQRELEQAASAAPPVSTEHRSKRKTAATGADEANKTQVIRDALAQHPNVTPAQLWGAVRGEIPNRNYVYSVLSRLRSKDELTVRRGRYSLKQVIVQEGAETKQQATLQ